MRRDIFDDWGYEQVMNLFRTGYSTENILYRYATQGAIDEQPGTSRVLCWGGTGRYSDITRYWLQLPPKQHRVFYIRYVIMQLAREDGRVWTARDAANMISMSHAAFKQNLKKACANIRRKINELE